jgi:hypothetical protein
MGIWFNVQTIPGAANYDYIWSIYVDGDNFLGFRVTDFAMQFIVEAQSTQYSCNATLVTANTWYYAVCKWGDLTSANANIQIWQNGIFNNEATVVNSLSGSPTGIDFANGTGPCDCYIGRVFISKDPDTPQIWTAFGKPLHSTDILKNGSLQQRGGTNGYDVVFGPDGSQIVTTTDELVGS